MLENATKLIAAAAAVDALQGKQLFPNSSLAVDARSATNEPVQPELRRREEATIKELADHSGKLQQLFNQLESDLVSDQGEDALAAHTELAMAGIDDSEIPAALAEPSLNLRVGSPARSSASGSASTATCSGRRGRCQSTRRPGPPRTAP